MKRGEAALARWVHRLLSALVILVPSAGWIFVSLAPESRPLDYRGLGSVPELWLANNDAASLAWHEVHELLGFALIGFLLFHIMGAFRQQLSANTEMRERMLSSGPRWLRPLVALSVLIWAVGLAFDLFGVRVT
jgi:cytochrome b561